MTINQVSVFTENKFGTIRNVAKLLGDSGIDIRAVSVADNDGYGVLRMVVSDERKAKEVLTNEECIVSITPVLGIVIPDVPGGLSSVLSVFSENRINIEYMYAFIARVEGKACVVVRVRNSEAAEKVLIQNHVEILSGSDLILS